MNNQTHPVSDEMLNIRHEAMCRRFDDEFSLTLGKNENGVIVGDVKLEIVAFKPSIYDFNMVSEGIPLNLWWRVTDAQDEDEEEYQPFVCDHHSGVIGIDDSNASLGSFDGFIPVEWFSPLIKCIGWKAMIDDMAVASKHRPSFVIDKVVYAENEDECIDHYHVIVDGELFGIVKDDEITNRMTIRYVNNPLFVGCEDLIADDYPVNKDRITKAAYEHWLMCNAAFAA